MQTSQPVRIPSTAAKSKPAEVPSARQLNIGTTPPAGSLNVPYGVTPTSHERERRQSHASLAMGADDEARSFHRTPSTSSFVRGSGDQLRRRDVSNSAPTFVGFQPRVSVPAAELDAHPAANFPTLEPQGPSPAAGAAPWADARDGHPRGLLNQVLDVRGAPSPLSPASAPANRASSLIAERASSLFRALQARYPALQRPVFASAFNAARQALGERQHLGEAIIMAALHGAAVVAELGLDASVASAALLLPLRKHLPITTVDAIVGAFPEDLRSMVMDAHRMGGIVNLEGATAASEDLRNILLSMADVRACVLCPSDCLVELRRLQARTPERRRAFARACLDILVPLASRIGLSSVKAEMEDLCFYHLEPEAHAALRGRFHTQARQDALQGALDATQSAMTAAGIPLADISGRVKSLFGIQKKARAKGIEPSQVLDAQALRVIVPTKADCYEALRVVQTTFKLVDDGHFKDYIRESKGNGYRSLHIVVEGAHGTPIEVQIRTVDMHIVSEYGAAAHWRYKESLNQDSLSQCSEKLVAYAKYLLSWVLEVHDVKCKPRGVSLDGLEDTVRRKAPLCTFPEHRAECNRHDERYCGSLEDLRQTACTYCGAAHFVLVDLEGRISVIQSERGMTLHDTLLLKYGPENLARRSFAVNGRPVVDLGSIDVSAGDVVQEVSWAAATQSRAAVRAEASEGAKAAEGAEASRAPQPGQIEIGITLSASGHSSISITRPRAPAPDRALAGTPAASDALGALGGGSPAARPASHGPSFWRDGLEEEPSHAAAPKPKHTASYGSMVSFGRSSSDERQGHPVVIGFGEGTLVVSSQEQHSLSGRELATLPA